MSEPAENLALQAQDATPKVPGTEDLVAEFRAIQAELDAKEASEAKPEPAKPAKVEPANDDKPKPAPKKGSEGKKTAADYAAERVNRRLAEKEASLDAKLAELDSKLSEVGGLTKSQLKDLIDSGKADDLAKILGAESWEELNGHFARLYASPEYKRIRELERREKERERADAERTARAEADRLRVEEAQAWADAQSEVGATLTGLEDPVLAKFGEAPHFCAEVLRRVVASGDDAEIEEVAEKFIGEIVERTQRWVEDLGDRLTKKAEASKEETPVRAGRQKQPEKPHKHVSRNSAAEASAELPDTLSDEEFYRTVGPRLMREAFLKDDEERRKNRA